MSKAHVKRETLSLGEATVSTKWEVAAIVEVFERTGGMMDMGQRVSNGTTH